MPLAQKRIFVEVSLRRADFEAHASASVYAAHDVDLPRKSPSRLFPKAAAGHGCAENAACLIMADWKPKCSVLFFLLPFSVQVEAASRQLGRNKATEACG